MAGPAFARLQFGVQHVSRASKCVKVFHVIDFFDLRKQVDWELFRLDADRVVVDMVCCP